MSDDELIARYREGQTYREIAAAAGCSTENVNKRLAKLRPQIAYRKPPLRENHPKRLLSAKRCELVVQLREQGIPTKEIAKRAGISEPYVHHIAPVTRSIEYSQLISNIEAQLN